MVPFESNVTWTNWVENRSVRVERLYHPTSLQDIVSVVRQAEADGKKLRGLGSGHSFSDVSVPSEYAIATRDFNKVLPLNTAVLHTEWQGRNLVEVEAGIRIQDLIDYLADHQLALPNLGSYTGQSIVSAITTGTHGSGLGLEALSGMVRSMTIVGSGGNIYRIEPSDGITDPDIYRSDTMQLKQDDDWFYSTVVSMGSFGITYSMILEVLPLYNLTELRELVTWEEIEADVMAGKIIGDYRHVELLISPYANTHGTHNCIITKRDVNKLNTPLDGSGRSNYWQQLSNFLRPFSSPAITTIFMNSPEQIPGFVSNAVQELEGRYTAVYNKVLSLGLDAIDGYAIEISYPLDKIAWAMNTVFSLAQHTLDFANANPTLPKIYTLYLSSPISLRFVKASKAYLSPQYGRDSCMLEFPFLRFAGLGAEHRPQVLLTQFQEKSYAVGGRPHWGLESGVVTGNEVNALYPMFGKWKQVHAQIDSSGTFRNAFTERLLGPLNV